MPGERYWQRRFQNDKALSVNGAELFIRKNQKKFYEKAGIEITKEIEKFYQKYADDNKISLAEAKKIISAADFRNIDWESYCQYDMDMVSEIKEKKDTLPEDIIAGIEKEHQEYEKKIQTLAAKGNVTRLELLQQDIEKTILNTYDKNQITIFDYLRNEYEDGYYRGIFNIQQGLGFGRSFAVVHTKAVEKVILGQQKRTDFSSRLYKHQKNLVKEIKDCLTVGMIRGESVDKLAKRVRQRIDVSYSNAKRLVRTETAYAFEQATLDSYAECGVERYMFMATLDNRTSEICQELDGQEFNIKDAVPGENYPPMHPNCRSTTVAVFDDDKVTERVARREDGTGYTVPSNMTYKEWMMTSIFSRDNINVLPQDAKEYCNAITSWTNSGYKGVRDYYKTHNDVNGKFEELSKTINEFITLSPKYTGTIYRGIASNNIRHYTVGKEINMNGISSWSTDMNVAEMFAKQKEYGHKTIFSLKKSKCAADINYISSKKYEKEVILSDESNQRVAKVTNKNGITYVELEEI